MSTFKNFTIDATVSVALSRLPRRRSSNGAMEERLYSLYSPAWLHYDSGRSSDSLWIYMHSEFVTLDVVRMYLIECQLQTRNKIGCTTLSWVYSHDHVSDFVNLLRWYTPRCLFISPSSSSIFSLSFSWVAELGGLKIGEGFLPPRNAVHSLPPFSVIFSEAVLYSCRWGTWASYRHFKYCSCRHYLGFPRCGNAFLLQ